MKKYKFVKIIFIATFIFIHSSILSYAGSDGLDVNLQVGSCNNNNICEVGSEDFFNCPLDCTPVVVPPVSGGSSGGGLVMDNVFNNLRVEVSYNSATIKWNSVIPTMSNLKWGTNPDYKDGVLRNINFLLDHKVELTNLKDGTVYYFSIEAENLLGKTNTLENQVFRTLSLLDTTPPSNPTNVKATSNMTGITITWDNPKDYDFDYIRVMKNTERFYGSPFIGYLVYEGKGTYTNDDDVVAGKKYYYTLFSRDRAGNYSSGALVSIIHNPTGKDTWGEVLTPAIEIEPLADKYIVTQGSSDYDFKIGSIFKLSGDAPITIKTNYSSKMKNDDMWVEIKNSDRRIIWQYFFSRVKDKDGFIDVTIPSFDSGGYYSITIYKYSSSLANSVARIMNQGAFQITKVGEGPVYQYSWYILWGLFLILLILLLLWLLYRIFRKMYERFKKE